MNKQLVCSIVTTALLTVTLHAHDWPEWRGRGRTGVWLDTDIIEKFPDGGPPLKWRVPTNSGFSGPSVAGGRVFVTDSKRADGEGIVHQATERVLAIDEQTGKILWTKEWKTNYTGIQWLYASGPRATPTVDGDRVYVLGTMGELFALDAATGRVLWQKDFVRDFNAQVPGWGMSSAPLVDGDRLICLVGGEPDAKVMALNKFTGEEIWRALSSDWEPGYSQPTIIEAGATRQLIIWEPRAINSLNPATGEIYWQVPHLVQMGMTIATPVRSGPFLLVTSQHSGAEMLRLDEAKPAATQVWQGRAGTPDTIDSVIGTPVIDGDYVYGLDTYGLLRCLELTTGKQVWETRALLNERAQYGTAFFVRQGDRYFINTDRGELLIARLSPKGFEEIDRVQLLEPTHPGAGSRREKTFTLWSHAAYANQHVILRNDKEIARFSLAREQ
jgi:outer membrane protein assembly factor BamB